MANHVLSEAVILDRVGGRSFSRGRRYYEQGAVLGQWREGEILKAKCWGSAPYPYEIWVRLGTEGIEAGECSCPVGGGGICKHTAAVLLAWLHEPESFRAQEPLGIALEQREKADLIFLIRQMIARHPDLEELIASAPSGMAGAGGSADPDVVRLQVEQVFNQRDFSSDPYHEASSIARELAVILDQADEYEGRDDWLSSSLVIRTVIDGLRARFSELYDHDGHLSTLFWSGSERLGECLKHIQEADGRLDILRTLVGVILKDINIGGYGFGDLAHDVVLSQATDEERMEIAAWVEESLAGLKLPAEYSGRWRYQAYGGLLLALQEGNLDDEQFMALCRRTRLLGPLVDRLLQLGRLEEAVSEAGAASDYDLLALADLFVTHGQEDTAEGLVWERAGRSKDTRLDGWLMKRAVHSGDWGKAIAFAEHQFWLRPDLGVYQEIKAIAEELGDWRARRETILGRLSKREAFDLVTRIHLWEGDVAAALTTLPKVKFAGDLALEVAKAAERAHPRQAIQLYGQKIERLIAHRGRENYAEAAGYLTRVKKLYEKLGEPDTWKAYIEGIRGQKPRLPALLDELKQAGL